MTERPDFDRRRAPSVRVIVSLVHSLYALMGLGEADDDRAFTVLPNRNHNKPCCPTEQPACLVRRRCSRRPDRGTLEALRLFAAGLPIEKVLSLSYDRAGRCGTSASDNCGKGERKCGLTSPLLW